MVVRRQQQPKPPAVSSAQRQDQNLHRPLPAESRLILQCVNGIHVPLTILPGSYNPGIMDSETILVPDSNCGFGVVSFPKSNYGSDFQRASEISEGGQRFNSSLRSQDSDSDSTGHTRQPMAPVVDKDRKIVSNVETHLW
jgi:hypothetical protein